MADDISIDGCTMPMEAPASSAEFAAQVRECAMAGIPVFPVGGGVGLDYGRPPARPGVAMSLARLDQVIDYPARDMTVTIEAGITVAKLQALLAAEGQRLPIDVPSPERATLGGAIAVDAAGPRRLGYGRFRDWIIGMTVVNGLGELCSAGGRVVKNVAGYDLAKLYTGSMGSLGIITQVTLKLQPIPTASDWASFVVAADDIARSLDAMHVSATRAAAVELVNDGSEWHVAVLYEDNADAVAWQLGELQKIATTVLRPPDGEKRYVSSPAVAQCPIALLATMPPSAMARFIRAVHRPGMLVQAHALSGVVRFGFAEVDLNAVKDLQQLALGHVAGGNVVIRRCPVDWKAQLPVWGRLPASLKLMQRVKLEFDTKNVLNPGRGVW